VAVQESRATAAGLPVERNGINVIAESERKGRPRVLFWPWCASNIAVLSISYGSFFLGFGVSFWQATIAGVAGIVLSFLLVGFVSLAGKRGSAPTMVLSRAGFGVRGNALPAAASWLLLVGWETVLVALSTLAAATVFAELGWSSGTVTKVVAFLVVAAVIVAVGMLGFDVIMKVQTWLTVLLAIMTVGYVALTADTVSWSAVSARPGGSATAVLGVLVLAATSLGLGWVNSGADYSRYLPRGSSSRGVVGWTTFGGSVAPVLLVVYGVLLAGSSQDLSGKIATDPVGALTTLLPTWYLVPFALVAIGGLVSGAILDIYSSGLALLTLGLRVPRWTAAGVDGVLMILGTIYLVWVASDFIGPFQAFLITLGVPIAAWCGYFLGDLAVRRHDYAEADLYDPRGRYGAVNPVAVAAMAIGTAAGWGLVTSTANGFGWEGYLLHPAGLGGRAGSWAFANLGVLVALAVGFLAAMLTVDRVRRQEAGAGRAGRNRPAGQLAGRGRPRDADRPGR
jgi:purine-cytosine permease-like protein